MNLSKIILIVTFYSSFSLIAQEYDCTSLGGEKTRLKITETEFAPFIKITTSRSEFSGFASVFKLSDGQKSYKLIHDANILASVMFRRETITLRATTGLMHDCININ